MSSIAGECIPKIHVRLIKRIERKGQPSRLVGYKETMEWPAYAGWEATPIYQLEIEKLRKEWSIPFETAEEDITFVYDDCILKKVKLAAEKNEHSGKSSKIKG